MPHFRNPDPKDLEALKTSLGNGGWRGEEDAGRYFDDPRGRFTGQGSLVLLPDSTAQVAKIVRFCGDRQIGLIPYGGGTGVVAGQLSPECRNAVILSLERMNRIREIRADDYAMVAEAGCILADVHEAAEAQGFVFPLSMASRGSCTIGGNLATNAGGIQVVRHGNARDLCLGIEAVLASGEIISDLSPLRKNNTGYDLRHLLIGSEGTLGIITAATLVLKPMDATTITALCALGSPADALRVYQALRREVGEAISGLELLSDFGIGLVTSHFAALHNPFAQPSPWYLLLELSGAEDLRARTETALTALLEADLLRDVVLASSGAQRQALWDLRENTPEANRLTGAICNSDTSVPISAVDAFIAASHAEIRKQHPELRINSYGHIGDGNIHHNVFPPEGTAKADFVASHPGIITAVRMAINEVTDRFDGSISAEHGIGRLKTEDFLRFANPAKVTTMRRIKSALDPDDILNPGALLG